MILGETGEHREENGEKTAMIKVTHTFIDTEHRPVLNRGGGESVTNAAHWNTVGGKLEHLMAEKLRPLSRSSNNALKNTLEKPSGNGGKAIARSVMRSQESLISYGGGRGRGEGVT